MASPPNVERKRIILSRSSGKNSAWAFLDPINIIRGSGLLLLVMLAVWKNERFHIAAVALCYGLLAAWVGLTMFEI